MKTQLAVCTSDDECPRGYRCDLATQICAAPTDSGLADTGRADSSLIDARADAGRDDAVSDRSVHPDQAPLDRAIASDAIAEHPSDVVAPDTGPVADAALPDRLADGGTLTSDSGPAGDHPGFLYWQDFAGPNDVQADDGTWALQSGVFRETDPCTDGADCHIGDQSFGDVRVRADLRFDQVCASGLQQAGILVRAQSLAGCNNRYYLCVVDLDDALLMLGKFENSCTTTADYSYGLSGVVAGTWYTMTVAADGDSIRCELAGPGIDTPYWVQFTYLGTTWLSGGVGLRTTGAAASFDNLIVEAL